MQFIQYDSIFIIAVISGLSLVAMTAPSDKFLTFGGPLAAGLGVVLVSSLGMLYAYCKNY